MGLAQARESARHGFFSVLFLRWTRKAAATLGDGFYLADKSQSSPSVHCLLTYIVFLFPPGYCHRDQVTGGPLFLMDHYGNAVSFYPVFLSPRLMLFFISSFAVGSFFTPGEETRSCVFMFYVLFAKPQIQIPPHKVQVLRILHGTSNGKGMAIRFPLLIRYNLSLASARRPCPVSSSKRRTSVGLQGAVESTFAALLIRCLAEQDCSVLSQARLGVLG